MSNKKESDNRDGATSSWVINRINSVLGMKAFVKDQAELNDHSATQSH